MKMRNYGLMATTALLMTTGFAMAQSPFTTPGAGFTGSTYVYFDGEGPILAGGVATIEGSDLAPGQTVNLLRGTTPLTPEPITVDAEGNLKLTVSIPDDAAVGSHPIVVVTENPSVAEVVDLKVSPVVPPSNEDKFQLDSVQVTKRPYQVAYSPASKSIFVTGSVGRPPIKESELVKLDAATWEKQAQITPAPAPAQPDGKDGGLFAVYGVGVDDANGNVWVTNTRQGTLAVYKQADLSLVKQFPPNEDGHPRDVLIDNGQAYVSGSFHGDINVYDTATLEELDSIHIKSESWDKEFGAMALDIQGGKLVTTSLTTPEAAIIDLASKDVRVLPLTGVQDASGVAYDPQDGLLFVVSQQNDKLLIVDEKTGEIAHSVLTGAGPLNVAFDPKSRLAFVGNRDSGTVTVVDTKGEIVANLPVNGQPNQLRADGLGNIWAVTMSGAQETVPESEKVWRIHPVG